SAPVVLDGLPTAPTALDLGRPGSLTWDLRDGDGAEIPARVELLRDGALVTRIYATPLDRRAPVAPGAYTARVSRGYEYTIWEGPVEVPPDGEATLSVTLERVIDTTGWMSMDSHVHAADSPDSDVSNADRARTAAAAGLEVIISTDHEIVSSIDAGVQAVGLDDHVATVVGQEVTATIPEHTNAFPMTPDPTLPRGGNPPWYGEDLAGVFALERERGAGVVQLNHPRLGCSWMCMIQWNRITGEADYPDPTALSFGPDAHLWDWNFDAIEYMNGNRSPLLDPAIPDASGLLDDWLAFLNLGHRITAMGVTDVHGLELPGEPRTYYVSPTDAPSAFDERDMVDAILGGRAQVSAGAFARVDIDGAGPGEDVTVDGVGHLRVHIEALPEIDVTRAQVLVNCDEVAVIEATDPGGVVKLDATLDLALDRDAHVVVLAFGEAPMPAALDDYDADRVPRVTTNAIFVDADGDGAWTPPGGKACAYSVGPR
ncbi:MAG TPA: CehA/McbA family metallohydrolase, partial [Myxococcota bacterium]|nr:CehA/McbA family metallohydrolase [Myxococcota bacterium]